MATIEPVFLFCVEAEIGAIHSLGSGPQGPRMIVPAAAGKVSGPSVNGRIVPGAGVEWATLRDDGSIKADVRLVLETDDGATLLMVYQGIAAPVGDSLKVTVAPLFETDSERYAWLNNVQAIGLGTPTETGIKYDVYQLNW